MGDNKKICDCDKRNHSLLAHEYGQAAIIRVGAEERDYLLHKGLLSHHSRYFKNRFSSRWPQDDTAIINVPDDDAEAFDIFFSWLYTHSPYITSPRYNFHANTPDDVEKLYRVLAKAYILADMLQIPGLKNAITDRYITT
ncbi:hypothetical protein EJ08DRAFT_362956 [Tothia fuscella]|uniref:BTB domain-containing protein n=1 Tax=Tothia fuscella TaxID=1048955 RepID=A0A9P4TWB1_9PEZI|nr:hypothetical protein EJ08DRAFT_362956 [Tothia fuscella]